MVSVIESWRQEKKRTKGLLEEKGTKGLREYCCLAGVHQDHVIFGF